MRPNPWEPLDESGRVELRWHMGPIKAKGLSHDGAVGQFIERRVGPCDAQDSRS